jgi:hypothetical protein
VPRVRRERGDGEAAPISSLRGLGRLAVSAARNAALARSYARRSIEMPSMR